MRKAPQSLYEVVSSPDVIQPLFAFWRTVGDACPYGQIHHPFVEERRSRQPVFKNKKHFAKLYPYQGIHIQKREAQAPHLPRNADI